VSAVVPNLDSARSPLRLHEFSSTAGHELRTPLTSLQATLELLGQEAVRDDASAPLTAAGEGAG
jgi:signal transduction histidine kinase